MSNAETASTLDYRHFVKLNHSNYHEWEAHARSELMKAGVWRFCTGEEMAPVRPTDPGSPPTTTTGDVRDKWMKLSKEYNEELRHHNEHNRRNDKAVGTICALIEPEQFEYVKDKTTAKEVWDTLKAKHANVNTGLTAFYTKIGMLEKKYTDGEDLHAHFNFIIMENRKLGKKAFDDEFLAQILLMSLPRDSVTWETLTVALLQAATETTPLKSDDVMRRCMVQHQRLNGNESGNSALYGHGRFQRQHGLGPKKATLSRQHSSSRLSSSHPPSPTPSNSSETPSSSNCEYCDRPGHSIDQCRDLQSDLKKDEFRQKHKPGEGGMQKESANLGVYSEFPSLQDDYNDDDRHVF